MIKNHISNLINKQIQHEPTVCQSALIGKLGEFVHGVLTDEMQDNSLFIVKGYAGTGKTTVMGALVKSLQELKLKSVLLAPTGRAAKVLSSYTNKNASTVHKKIYRQKTVKDGIGEFVLDKNLHKNTIFIVDEASMIANSGGENSIFGSGRLLTDLLNFVYSGVRCAVILVGDTAQLPPVGLQISPALDSANIESMGYKVTEHTLTTVVRQQTESGILHNATIIRENISNNAIGYPHLQIEGFPDIERIDGSELIEKIEECYDRFGMENTIVVCRSNKRANRYNEGIRRTIMWKEEELSVGDYLMIVKNNYYWLGDEEKSETNSDFIANGDIVEVTRIKKHQDLYDYRFADVSLRFTDYQDLEIDAKIILDTLSIETASLTGEANNQFFFRVMEDYMNLKTKKARIQAVKNNPHFNALQVKFSYAITCHKAQGGQWDAVFIDQGWLRDDMLDIEYLRWLYTAFTRPVKKLYLVNFNKEFFY